MKKFVIQYANYRMDEIEKSGMDEKKKHELQAKVDRAVFYCKIGEISIDECMARISDCK